MNLKHIQINSKLNFYEYFDTILRLEIQKIHCPEEAKKLALKASLSYATLRINTQTGTMKPPPLCAFVA